MSKFHNSSENDASKSKWVSDTHDYRREAVQVREEIPPQLVHTNPFDVPEIVDYYNRLLYKYHGQLLPKAEAVGDLWTTQLGSVDVPPSGQTVDAGMADVFGNVDTSGAIHGLEWEPRPVSLANLRDWREASFTVTLVYQDPGMGPQNIVERKALYLPVNAIDTCMDQLNRVLEDLGWLPDAAEKELSGADDPLMPGGPEGVEG